MPVALLLALASSLVIHAVALFGTDLELLGKSPEPQVLQAELRPLPPAPSSQIEAPHRLPKKPKVARLTNPQSAAQSVPDLPEPVAEIAPAETPATENATPVPAQPVLPGQGVIRYAIFKDSLGLQVGRAEHYWEFSAEGLYRLRGTTETSGLAALIKPVRLDIESRGRIVAGGLQPESFRSLKNGEDANENADFDWSTGQVKLSRDGSLRDIAPGTQDILSLNYQLAYIANLEGGTTLGVVTGKKYERYNLDSLGEEEIDTPLGRFRTLHLRAMTDNTTEIWIALDLHRLPVKIRFTDKKGDSYSQLAIELGRPVQAAPD